MCTVFGIIHTEFEEKKKEPILHSGKFAFTSKTKLYDGKSRKMSRADCVSPVNLYITRIPSSPHYTRCSLTTHVLVAAIPYIIGARWFSIEKTVRYGLRKKLEK